MSGDTHYSASKEGVGPTRFLCGRKNNKEHWYTRNKSLVECPQCLAKLRQTNAASTRTREQR